MAGCLQSQNDCGAADHGRHSLCLPMTAHADCGKANHPDPNGNRSNQRIPRMREDIPQDQAKRSLRWVMEKHALKTMLNTRQTEPEP